jgi:PKHD-type hydroxylase
MLLRIPAILDKAQVAQMRAVIDAAEWIDGNATSGHQSGKAKDNLQLAEDSQAARSQGALVMTLLEKVPTFIAAALPASVYPPLFNRYAGGQAFGPHIDNAVRRRAGSNFRIRTDLSATLFLSEAADYDGGELVIEDTYGVHSVKLAAGDLILYPSSSLHQVTPVTRGARVACVFWVQSLVRDDAQRTLLFDMDLGIRALSQKAPDDAAIVSLTGVYHNLLRMWAEP